MENGEIIVLEEAEDSFIGSEMICCALIYPPFRS